MAAASPSHLINCVQSSTGDRPRRPQLDLGSCANASVLTAEYTRELLDLLGIGRKGCDEPVHAPAGVIEPGLPKTHPRLLQHLRLRLAESDEDMVPLDR